MASEFCSFNKTYQMETGDFSLPTITIDFQIRDFTNQAGLPLRHITARLEQHGILGHVTIPQSLSQYTKFFQLIQSMVYLTSNNLLNPSGMRKLLDWIPYRQLTWIVTGLIDSQLPAVSIFINKLFLCAVDARYVDFVTALLDKGVNPNLNRKAVMHHSRLIYYDDHCWSMSPLQIASRNADLAMLHVLFRFKAVVNNTTIANNSAGSYSIQTELDFATEGPRLCLHTIRLLLQKGANANIPIQQGSGSFTSVLNRALELNEAGVVRELLSAGACVNDHQCGQSVTALQTASKYCDAEMVQLLIDKGADVNIPIHPQYRTAQTVAREAENYKFFITPLQQATERNDIDMMKILLANHAAVDGFDFCDTLEPDCDIDDTDEDEDESTLDGIKGTQWKRNGKYMVSCFKARDWLISPLQACIIEKHNEATNLLLQYGPSIDMIGPRGTALQVACMQQGNIDIVKELVKRGANINSPAPSCCGLTALQAAILSADMEVVQFLLDKGADARTPASRRNGLTALQAAAEMGYTQLARVLIERGADPNEASSRYNGSSLHLAAYSGNMDLVRLLLKHKANLYVPRSLKFMNTVLAEAIYSGKHEVVKAMLDAGANPSIEVEGSGDELFSYGYVARAVVRCDYKTIELLLRKGASPTTRNYKDETPLELAVSHGYSDVIRLLLRFQRESGQKHDGCRVLNCAIRMQDENLVRILLSEGVDVDKPDDHWILAPLVVAAKTENSAILRILLKAGANIHGRAGIHALAVAIKANHKGMIQLFLSSNIKAEHIPTERSYSTYPLSAAIKNRRPAIIDALLNHDVGFYLRDARALSEAVISEDLQLVHRLLSLGPPVDTQTAYKEAISATLSACQVSMAETLIIAGADVDAIFGEVIQRGLLAMVEMFIRRGAQINPTELYGKHRTPLQDAIYCGSFDIVNLLLDRGADVNAPAPEGELEALELAAEKGHFELVHKILTLDKEPDTLQERIKLAADGAIWNGFPLVAKYLEDWRQQTSGNPGG